MARFGLIGRSLKHSFSQQYFTEFFQKEGLPHSYSNYELSNTYSIRKLIEKESLTGINVTIPFKNDVIPLLDEVDPVAQEIGAVNVVRIHNGKLQGFNTDHIGFSKSLQAAEGFSLDCNALVLGTGGASKAIKYALNQLGIEFLQVSRSTSADTTAYKELTEQLIADHRLIINCTPLGTFPDVDGKPEIQYSAIGAEHLLYDLVYNPEITAFMKEGLTRSASVMNGYEMLRIQAEESWRIWSMVY